MATPYPLCYVNGSYVAIQDARISPFDRGFLYADGVYELMPVYAGRPFRFKAHLERMTAFAPLAALANISGFPAITVPFGADAGGLPLPVQLIAPFGHEPLLLSLAAALEAEGRWQHRFPVAGLVA